jgi:hypothetical protein
MGVVVISDEVVGVFDDVAVRGCQCGGGIVDMAVGVMVVGVVDVAVGVVVVNMAVGIVDVAVGIVDVVVVDWWWWEERGVVWLSHEQPDLEAAGRGLPDVLNMPSIPSY